MIDEDLLAAIQILGLKAAEEPDSTQIYRRICRWYSREFSTPLVEVEEMDMIHVLTHYFEETYTELSTSDNKDHVHKYEKIKAELLYPDELREKEESEDEWIKKLEAEQAAQEQTQPPATEEKLNLTIPEEFRLPDSGGYSE